MIISFTLLPVGYIVVKKIAIIKAIRNDETPDNKKYSKLLQVLYHIQQI